jgi:hypothetical protein
MCHIISGKKFVLTSYDTLVWPTADVTKKTGTFLAPKIYEIV